MRIQNVACVGAGLIGASWASLFVMRGCKVTLQDLNEELLDKAVARVRRYCNFLAEQGIVVGQDPDIVVGQMRTTTSAKDAVESADYVQESTFESYDVKKPVFKEVDAAAPDSTIVATSSSGLLISKLQKVTRNPSRFIGAHPFNPPHLIPLVELIKGKQTSVDTVTRTFEFMKAIGKVPIILKKEVPGYAANRLAEALWREAIDLVDRGVASVEDVDKAVTASIGLRWAIMGPHLTYHLGGGEKGMAGFIEQFGPNMSTWWKSMRTWTTIRPAAARKVVKGIQSTEMVRSKTLEELERWRDLKLAKLLKVQREGPLDTS